MGNPQQMLSSFQDQKCESLDPEHHDRIWTLGMAYFYNTDN